jgi:glyoxylase-like metal-dependent hydrolase (beta-lactamase superfamily II)
MDRFELGSATIHRIEEWRGNFAAPQDLLEGCTPQAFAPYRQMFAPGYYDPANDMLYAFLQSWLLEIDGLRILIDTGAGNDKQRPGIPVFGNLQSDYLANLEQAGFTPDDIDVVICTHLHIDHVGWNTRLDAGGWTPAFRRARYLFPAIDEEFWNPANAARFPVQKGRAVNACVYEDSVAPVIAAGQAQLVQANHRLSAGVMLLPAPGHTPGHLVVHAQSDSRHALFVGDVLHHPVQVLHPEWNSVYCEDAGQARRSRIEVLQRAADLDALLFPAHFGGMHACRVRRHGQGFRPEFLP